MLNSITVMGRFVSDPELRYTPNNVAVTSFTLASERDYVSKETEKREVDWIDVVAWRELAENITKYFRKGRMIIIVGSLQTRTYTDQNGTKRKATEIKAESFYFADSKPANSGENAAGVSNYGSSEKSQNGPVQANYGAPNYAPDYEEISIPFAAEDLPF